MLRPSPKAGKAVFLTAVQQPGGMAAFLTAPFIQAVAVSDRIRKDYPVSSSRRITRLT